jgi:hypothetical protein
MSTATAWEPIALKVSDIERPYPQRSPTPFMLQLPDLLHSEVNPLNNGRKHNAAYTNRSKLATMRS